MNYEALNKAVEIAGSQTALAKRMGDPIRQAHVWNWLNRDKTLPAERAIQIERVTDGQVTRQDLRPDIFGQPHDPSP